MPLASLLYTFLTKHAQCLNSLVGEIDLAAIVPPTKDRKFSPVEHLLSVTSPPANSQWYDWQPDALRRELSRIKPQRATFSPQSYIAESALVQGKSILLVDDTWTSGASMVSAAGALKRSGAKAVIGLTLGRQLSPGSSYGNNIDLYQQSMGRGWSEDECTICVG